MNINWLTPLGFLGLLSIIILIIIYIIKPNYQQKMISSSFVWKLSLKYKKKRIPISRIRNLIILICQILILTVSGFILAQPFIKAQAKQEERIMIIDASASMLATQDGITRFERAVSEAKKLGENALGQQISVTVILAGKKAKIVIGHADSPAMLKAALDELVVHNESMLPVGCTFGLADIDGAMLLAEEILDINSGGEVFFFTGTEYANVGKVKIVDVSIRNGEDQTKGEWNAAIIDVTSVFDDNRYTFEVVVANYNSVNDMNLTINIRAEGVNYEKKTIISKEIAACRDNKPLVVVIDDLNEEIIYSYKSIQFSLDEDDSFHHDNNFFLYGGIREEIKIQYVSNMHNRFVRGALTGLKNHRSLSALWDIEIKEIDINLFEPGFADFYIFEHQMPFTLPEDGVVLLINPDTIPTNLEIAFGDIVRKPNKEADNFPFTAGIDHPVINFIDTPGINVSEYRVITAYDGFDALMFCNDDPVFLIKNTKDEKVSILPFSVHNSSLPLLPELSVIMFNLFNYYMPPTLTRYVYDVDEPVSINARGSEITVSDLAGKTLEELNSFPAEFSASKYGIYTLTQELMSKKFAVDNFYIKIIESESNFSKIEETLKNPLFPPPQGIVDLELMSYFALAMLALLFIERLLHTLKERI